MTDFRELPHHRWGVSISKWIRLAMPDDVAQEIALAGILGRTRHQKATILAYRLRKLRYECWDTVGRRPRKPHSIRPSKIRRASGYRRDHSKRLKR